MLNPLWTTYLLASRVFFEVALTVRFITNGPEIPDALLHAHDEGRMVFFCGAGLCTGCPLPEAARVLSETRNVRVFADARNNLHQYP